MVAVFIFYIHVIFLVYVFTKDYLEDGFVTGLLSAILIVVIFSVGWTLTEFVMGFFMSGEGLGLLFPRAAFSLVLLSIAEGIFYKFYFSRKASKVHHSYMS
jgi:hypothetical protein